MRACVRNRKTPAHMPFPSSFSNLSDRHRTCPAGAPARTQVLTFFMDCRLHVPSMQHGDGNELDSLMDTADTDPAAMPRLMHMPSLLESPAPGQEVSGAWRGV